jgi:hypothetical protein
MRVLHSGREIGDGVEDKIADILIAIAVLFKVLCKRENMGNPVPRVLGNRDLRA